MGWDDKLVTQGYLEVSGGHFYVVRYNDKRTKVAFGILKIRSRRMDLREQRD